MKVATHHPCFSQEAHFNCGRLHLPVAPKCNIQCAYCDRRYDCVNESRPGVTSKILTADTAIAYAKKYIQLHPETTVVGIAGPGEPLANEATFAVFEALDGVIKCVSTNGMLLPSEIKRLKRCGVSALTITMNTLDLHTAEKLYCSGTDCAQLLCNQQLGLKTAAEAGFHIKINTVLVSGVNDTVEEIEAIAQFAAQNGADIMNMNALIPAGKFSAAAPPPKTAVCNLRKIAGKYIKQFHLCRQCRADAAGIPAYEA